MYADKGVRKRRAVCGNSGVPDHPIASGSRHCPVSKPGGAGEAARKRRTR